MHRFALPTLALALAITLALTACDGDDGPAGDVAGPSDVTTADAAADSTADAAPEDAGGAGDAVRDGAGGADVPSGDAPPGDAAPGDGAGPDAVAPCDFEGLAIPPGESRCPCEQGCDEVITCAEDGLVMASECLMGFTCIQETPTAATCVCSNLSDSVCPPEGLCPEDPDCAGDPCTVEGQPLPIGDRACDCSRDPCVLVQCLNDGSLFEQICEPGLVCIEINASTAGCTCDDEADGTCPAACPTDPDC